MGGYIRRVLYILGGTDKAYIFCFKRLSIGSNHEELSVVRTFTDSRLFGMEFPDTSQGLSVYADSAEYFARYEMVEKSSLSPGWQ